VRERTVRGRVTLIALIVVELLTFVDGALTVTPRNASALLGTSVTLHCSTDVMSTPVNWYCSGTCSANTTVPVAYLFMAGELTDSLAHRVSIVSDDPRACVLVIIIIIKFFNKKVVKRNFTNGK